MNQVPDQVDINCDQFDRLQKEFNSFEYRFFANRFIPVLMILFPILMLSIPYRFMREPSFIELISPRSVVYPEWFALVLAIVYAIFGAVWLYAIYSVIRVLLFGLPDLRNKLISSSLAQELKSGSIRFEQVYEHQPKWLRSFDTTALGMTIQTKAKTLVDCLDWFLEKPTNYNPYGLKKLWRIFLILLMAIMVFTLHGEFLYLLSTPLMLMFFVVGGILQAQSYAKVAELRRYL